MGFLCLLYGDSTMSVTELRYKIFSNKKNTPAIKPSPTVSAVRYHILLAHLQCMLWKAADSLHPLVVGFTKFGWENVQGHFRPVSGVNVVCASELMMIVACGCSSFNKTIVPRHHARQLAFHVRHTVDGLVM